MLRIALTVVMVLGAASSSVAQAGDVAAGAKVYALQKCGVCHSIAGKGNPNGALDDVGSRLTADEIRMWIADAKGMTAKTKAPRKPLMRDYNLPADQLDALIAYMQSLKKT